MKHTKHRKASTNRTTRGTNIKPRVLDSLVSAHLVKLSGDLSHPVLGGGGEDVLLGPVVDHVLGLEVADAPALLEDGLEDGGAGEAAA